MKEDLDFQVLNPLQTKFRGYGIKKNRHFNSDYIGSNKAWIWRACWPDIRNDNETSCLENDKSVPLQAWSGPEGSRKLRFPQEGGKVVSLTHRSHLPPGNPPGTHFC